MTPVNTLSSSDPLADLTTEDDVIRHKDRVAGYLRARLTALGYDRAVACLDIITSLRGGALRRDGKTPAILHELSQAFYTMRLLDKGLLDARDPDTHLLFCVNFCHDAVEDFGGQACADRGFSAYGSSLRDKRKASIAWLADEMARRMDRRYAVDRADIRAAALMWRMGKSFDGDPLYATPADYYRRMLPRWVNVVAKCMDRVQNNASLVGASGDIQLEDYIEETRTKYGWFLEDAKTRHPAQKTLLNFFDGLIAKQVRLIERGLGLETGRAHLPSLKEIFTAAAALDMPRGFNPLYMIEERIRALNCPPQFGARAWRPALERRPEV